MNEGKYKYVLKIVLDAVDSITANKEKSNLIFDMLNTVEWAETQVRRDFNINLVEKSVKELLILNVSIHDEYTDICTKVAFIILDLHKEESKHLIDLLQRILVPRFMYLESISGVVFNDKERIKYKDMEYTELLNLLKQKYTDLNNLKSTKPKRLRIKDKLNIETTDTKYTENYNEIQKQIYVCRIDIHDHFKLKWQFIRKVITELRRQC